MPDRHLAQINIARMRAPLDDPVMADFVEMLDEINAAADRSPGFIWRLQTEEGNSTSIRAYDDPMLLVNMSVWESVESLADYVYRSVHLEPLRRRRDWFAPMDEPHLALWWVAAGRLPRVAEGKRRLELLRTKGPSADAFDFQHRYSPDGQTR